MASFPASRRRPSKQHLEDLTTLSELTHSIFGEFILLKGTGRIFALLILLKKYGYSGTSYYDLGLHLGLSTRTLDIIKENNTGDVESCLKKCLTKWLEQADDVKSNGGPTHYSLIKALRKIEQNAVADGIHKESKKKSFIIIILCI